MWTGIASTASSRVNRTKSSDENRYRLPAINPVMTAAQGSTVEHPAVIATRPPRHPLAHFIRLNFPSPVRRSVSIKLMRRAATPPDAAASVVLTAASEVTLPWVFEDMVNADPALKPYQPNQSMNKPRTYNEK